VSEFHGSDGFVPDLGVQRAINSDVSFDFLIEAFCGSITLRMIGCGQFRFDSKEFEEFLEGFGGELGISVRDNGVGESKVFVDVIE